MLGNSIESILEKKKTIRLFLVILLFLFLIRNQLDSLKSYFFFENIRPYRQCAVQIKEEFRR